MTTSINANEQAISVVTYNVHKGMSAGNRRLVLREIRDALHGIHADIVLLQEVVGADSHGRYGLSEFPDTSQFEYLADSLWDHYAYGRNAVYDNGHHGNAILSRYPIKRWDNFDLSQTRFERRGLLHAEILIPDTGQTFDVGCLHLNLMQYHRRRQITALANRINEVIPLASPLILAGDFNDWRGRASKVLARELNLVEAFSSRHGAYARTFPSIYPILTLDRIYTRGVAVNDAEVLDDIRFRRLSDHLGLRMAGHLSGYSRDTDERMT